MSDIPLKSCPFCGSHAYIFIHAKRNRYEMYQAVCSNEECIAQFPEVPDAKQAVMIWNRRVGDE